MSDPHVHKSRAILQKRLTARDKDEINNLTRHYEQYVNWENDGILYDLKVIHGRDDPSQKLFLCIALGVSDQAH
jgi:hypothetical protein